MDIFLVIGFLFILSLYLFDLFLDILSGRIKIVFGGKNDKE